MKPLKISIPEPCHENWNQMTATEKGRFCEACKKCVTDYRSWSDRQIVSFLNENPGEHCGKFNPEQLNRYLYEPIQNNFRSRVTGVFFGVLAMLGANTKAGSTHEAPKNKMSNHFDFERQQKNVPSQKEQTAKKDSSNFITGIVYNARNYSPLVLAEIKVNGYGLLTLTNEKGEFSIEIPATLQNLKLQLQVSSGGFKNYQIAVDGTTLPLSLNVSLYPKGYQEPLPGIMMIEH